MLHHQQGVPVLNGIQFEQFAAHTAEFGYRGYINYNQRNPYNKDVISEVQQQMPLRILVHSDMIGAIIGRNGNSIRDVTQLTQARIYIDRKKTTGLLKKAITIYGNPQACTNACKLILQIMQLEADIRKSGFVALKILVHNNLVGRIIGKNGHTINQIMEETSTKIAVSSLTEINCYHLERVITVKGSIDNMSRAEHRISLKLRLYYENDLKALKMQSVLFPGVHPFIMMSMPCNGMGLNLNAPGVPSIKAIAPNQRNKKETVCLYVPNASVGAIIGAKGYYIRAIMRFSSASVVIAPFDKNDPTNKTGSRKVTIMGTPESQWRAQYMIFEKLRAEGFRQGTDDARLTVEISVARSQMGRVIGKRGQSIRFLQRFTGSIIKTPKFAGSQVSSVDQNVPISIFGPFYSVQLAQRRIRMLLMQPYSPKKQKTATDEPSSEAEAAAGQISASQQQQEKPNKAEQLQEDHTQTQQQDHIQTQQQDHTQTQQQDPQKQQHDDQQGPPKNQQGPPQQQNDCLPNELQMPPQQQNDQQGPPKNQQGPPQQQNSSLQNEQQKPTQQQNGSLQYDQQGPPKNQQGPPQQKNDCLQNEQQMPTQQQNSSLQNDQQGPPKNQQGPPQQKNDCLQNEQQMPPQQ